MPLFFLMYSDKFMSIFSKNDSGRVFAFPVGAKELNAVNETDLDTEEERQHKIKMVVIGES